jgi:hypothetical protein
MIDYDVIRAHNPLPAFCASRGMRLRRDGVSGRFKTLCPLHNEKHPSFTICPDGYFYCYGCGAHGDVTELCAAMDGISKADAARKLNGTGDLFPSTIIRAPEPAKPLPYQLSLEDRQRMASAAHRLASNAVLIDKLIGKRPEWIPDAIRNVAFEGDLGYEADRILFAYSHGIKARWKDSAGERVIRWLIGSPANQCWRQSLLLPSHQNIYITEGETDALTLISLGLELPGKSLAIALAGAAILPAPQPFSGINIIIVPDPDEAGEKAEKKLRALLQPVARSITSISMEEVCNE